MARPRPNSNSNSVPAEQSKQSFMLFRDAFLSSQFVRAHEMPTIDAISRDENPYLLPYYLVFLERMVAYTSGVFIMDTRGIYTPVEKGQCGVVHVVRLPATSSPVYALTDLIDTAIMWLGERIVIFQGVTHTTDGFKFIDEKFRIIPISGLSFSFQQRMVRSDLRPGEAEMLPAQAATISQSTGSGLGGVVGAEEVDDDEVVDWY